MKEKSFLSIIIFVFGLFIYVYSTPLAPPEWGVYHSAYCDFGDSEDTVTTARIDSFITLAGKGIVWAYFSNNWLDEIAFPSSAVATIHALGIIPYIRMMARSDFWAEGPDPLYTMQAIIDGDFDSELSQWAIDAAATDIPLIVEFGTEVNGDWFPWNGKWNGGDTTDGYGDPLVPDGPERFRDAYRHIIDLFRAQGADNITWVYHVNNQSFPAESWNSMAAYYPGDDYIDWIGISVYGALIPGDDWEWFSNLLDEAYPEFTAISSIKPLAVLEFGVVEDSTIGSKSAWITDALSSIRNGYYPRVKAISYWHELWINDDLSVSNLRIDSSPAALSAYRDEIADSFFLTEATSTGIRNSGSAPAKFTLNIFPNPFNSSCEITVPAGADVEIYDLRGNVVYKVPSPSVPLPVGEGSKSPSPGGVPTSRDRMRGFVWTPEKTIPSGIYLVRAKMSDGKIITVRTIYLK